MGKKTTEEFIEQAKKVHGNKYDYSQSIYTKCNDNIYIICPEHGGFWQQAGHHLSGRGCPECGGVKRLNTKTFIERSKKIHGNKYDYSKVHYINKTSKVTIICPKHGEFQQKAEDHYRGRGCQKCWFDEHTKQQTYTKEQFLKMAREKYGWTFDYSKVKWNGYEEPILIICPIHGEFWTTPHNHLACITGCPKCGREKANSAMSYTKEDFLNKAKAIHGDKYDYSKVEYVDYHTSIVIICKKHGEFKQTPVNHAASGQGCPKCMLKSQTKLQQRLQKIFPGHFLEWEYSPDWLNGQRIDIADAGLKIAIEFNGQQHYEPVKCFGGEEKFKWQQNQDKMKEECCKNNSFVLFKFKYDYNSVYFADVCKKIQEIIDNTQDNTGQITEEVEDGEQTK